MPSRPSTLALASLAFVAFVAVAFVLTRAVDPITALDERAFEGLGRLKSAAPEEEPLELATRALNPLPFLVMLGAVLLYGVRSGRAASVWPRGSWSPGPTSRLSS